MLSTNTSNNGCLQWLVLIAASFCIVMFFTNLITVDNDINAVARVANNCTDVDNCLSSIKKLRKNIEAYNMDQGYYSLIQNDETNMATAYRFVLSLEEQLEEAQEMEDGPELAQRFDTIRDNLSSLQVRGVAFYVIHNLWIFGAVLFSTLWIVLLVKSDNTSRRHYPYHY